MTYDEGLHKGALVRHMFDSFKVPALSIWDSAILSLYASGRTSGLVVESGHGLT